MFKAITNAIIHVARKVYNIIFYIFKLNFGLKITAVGRIPV